MWRIRLLMEQPPTRASWQLIWDRERAANELGYVSPACCKPVVVDADEIVVEKSS